MGAMTARASRPLAGDALMWAAGAPGHATASRELGLAECVRGISQRMFAEKSLGAGRARVRRKNMPEARKSSWGDVVGPHAAADKPPQACFSGLRSRDFGANVRWLKTRAQDVDLAVQSCPAVEATAHVVVYPADHVHHGPSVGGT